MKETIFAVTLTLILLSPFLYIMYAGIKYIWKTRKIKNEFNLGVASDEVEDVDAYCERIRGVIYKIERGVFDETSKLFADIYGVEFLVDILNRHLKASEEKNEKI